MSSSRIGLIAACVLVVTLSGCAMTSVRQHPDFASGKRQITTVAILPSDVEYRHLVFTGENERDAEREKTIAAEIESGMETLLKSHGYTTKAEVLEKAKAGDKEFNFNLEQLKGAYVQIAKELYATPMVQEAEASKFKVGVGPLANTFAAVSGADALMFARYQGFDKSDGLIAKEVVASALLAALTGSYYIPMKEGGAVELSLIDGVSGDILWSNAARGPTGAYAAMLNATAKLPDVRSKTAPAGTVNADANKVAAVVAPATTSELPKDAQPKAASQPKPAETAP